LLPTGTTRVQSYASKSALPAAASSSLQKRLRMWLSPDYGE
jgi:hypothetical protein